MTLVVKNLPANAGEKNGLGLIPGLRRSLGGEHSKPQQTSPVPGESHEQGSLPSYSP